MDAMTALVGALMYIALDDKAKMEDYFSESWAEKKAILQRSFQLILIFKIFWTFHLCPPNASREQANKMST
jgi:hypothetical protein